jgi:hypothetical protein
MGIAFHEAADFTGMSPRGRELGKDRKASGAEIPSDLHQFHSSVRLASFRRVVPGLRLRIANAL